MTVAELMEGARNQLRAQDFDACIDAAALAHARATDDETRASAAVLAARAFIGKGIPPDAILWLDPVIAANPRHAEALAYRGWAQRESDRLELAQADLDAAAATPGAPACAHYYRGLFLIDRGRTEEAMAALGDAAPDADVGTLALCKRAELRLEAGDRDGAVADFLTAARRDDRGAAARLMDLEALPDDEPAVTIAAAYACRALDNEPKALAMIAPLLDAGAGDDDAQRAALGPELRARALRLRGLAANAARDFAAAAEHYAAAAAELPADAAAQSDLGFALWNVDRDADAIAAFAKAIELGGRDGRPEMWTGDIHYAAQRWSEARDCYERALVRQPRHPGLLYFRALTLGQLGLAEEERAAMLDAAIAGRDEAVQWCREHDLTPPPQHFANADVGLRYGNSYAADTNYRFAADGWLAASRAPGDYCHRYAAMALSNACYAKSLTGDRTGAVALGARAVALRPGFRDGWLNYANQLCAVGRLEDAVNAYERAEWCHPFYAGSHYGRADALRRLGRAEESLAALQSAAKIGYEDQARDNDVHYRLARTYQALERWDEARAEYQHLDDAGMMPDETPSMIAAIDRMQELAAGEHGLEPVAGHRRYGVEPVAWAYERTNYTLRIQLERAPDAATRVALARAGAQAVAACGVEVDDQTWLWSDRFVFVTLQSESTDAEAMFAALGAIPNGLEEVAAVVEVVGFGAVGLNEGDALEQRSIATQPVPDAGPETTSHCAFWVSKIGDATRFPAPAADADVDRAVADAGAAVATARAEERAGAARARAEAGELVVVPVTRDRTDQDDGPKRFDWSALKREDDDWGTFSEAGAGIMLRRYEGYYTGVDRVLDDGSVHEVVPTLGKDPLLMRHIGSAVVSDDGRTAWWTTNLEHDVYRCDLVSGELACVLAGLPKVNTIALLDAGEVMVKTDQDLRIYAARDGELVLVASDATELGPARAWRGGKAIICGTVSEPELVVYGWAHGALARLAEITVEINCYSTEVSEVSEVSEVGDDDEQRVFCGGEGVTYELLNLDAAYMRFATWAREQAEARAQATGLVASVDSTAPSPGIQEGSYEARSAVAWLCTGEAGVAFALTSEGGGYRVAAADEDGAREVTPAIVGPSFQWDWSFDQKGVLVVNEGEAHEVDLVAGTSRRILDGHEVTRVSPVRDGVVALEDTALVVYARHSAELRETGRLELDEAPDELGVAEGGDVVFVRFGETVAFLAVDRDDGALYAMGTLELGDYFTAYLRKGQLYVQNTYEGSGTPVRRYRVDGLAPAREAAVARGAALASLELEEMDAGAVFGAESYDGMTEFNAKDEEC